VERIEGEDHELRGGRSPLYARATLSWWLPWPVHVDKIYGYGMNVEIKAALCLRRAIFRGFTGHNSIARKFTSFKVKRACDDSHLPVVQAGNLGTSYTPRAKKSLHCAAAWCTAALDVAITSYDNLMVRHLRCESLRQGRAC
jgi:hypothetical protein